MMLVPQLLVQDCVELSSEVEVQSASHSGSEYDEESLSLLDHWHDLIKSDHESDV